MDDFVIDQASWHTNKVRNYEFDKRIVYEYFNQIIRYMQDNGLTTRIILNVDDNATDDTCIKKSDLTEEGFDFVKKVYDKWTDKVVDKEISSTNFKLLDKALNEIKSKSK